MLENDSRINFVKSILSPFQEQFNKILEICSKDDYDYDYWDSIYADDTEHLIGTALIVLQNYINSSISDFYPELTKIYLKYALDEKISVDSKTTRVELIIALSNYYKHRDLPTELHTYTTSLLEDLNIEYKQFLDIEENRYFHKMGSDSPIFSGLSLLSEKWDLNDLIEIVSEWREGLWQNETRNRK